MALCEDIGARVGEHGLWLFEVRRAHVELYARTFPAAAQLSQSSMSPRCANHAVFKLNAGPPTCADMCEFSPR